MSEKVYDCNVHFRTQGKLKKRVTDLLNERTIMQKRFLMEEVHAALRDLLGKLISQSLYEKLRLAMKHDLSLLLLTEKHIYTTYNIL
jgi:hypothetical protein